METTTLEILNIIINKFKEENIVFFSKKELENQLYYFSSNDNYKSLFYNKTDIEDALNIFIKCGYLYRLDSNLDIIYIIKSDTKINNNKILEELLNTYFSVKKISQKYNNLNIYMCDPNCQYILLDANIMRHQVKWTLNTDGEIIKKNIKLVKGTKHLFDSPFDNKQIYFDTTDFEYVDVHNASYVIRQELMNNKICNSVLYTNIEDVNKIDEMAYQYCKKKKVVE